jgi:hypothetical protein
MEWCIYTILSIFLTVELLCDLLFPVHHLELLRVLWTAFDSIGISIGPDMETSNRPIQAWRRASDAVGLSSSRCTAC